MFTMALRNWILLLGLSLSLGLLAWAEVEHYDALDAAPSEIVTGGTAAESVDASVTIASRRKPVKGNPTIAVGVDFSGAAADTVVIYCILWQETDGTFTLMPAVQQSTATAGVNRDAAAGDFMANSLIFFDTAGATHYEIRHGLPSAGNVDISAWVFGLESE